MPTLEEIRRKKMEEQINVQQLQEEAQLQREIEQLEAMVKQVLTKEALVRYGTLKTAYPERAIQLLVVIAQSIQSGKVKSINDEMLKKILIKLTPEKREIKIKRV